MVNPLQPHQAVLSILRQITEDVKFPAGECQKRCREAYGVPTDGTPDAVSGWHRSTHRVGTPSFRKAPYGAFHRWAGGSEGHGHVAIVGGRQTCFSVDIGGPGWHRTTVPAIQVWAPSLVYLGWTLDIDGVLCVDDPEDRHGARSHGRRP